MNITKEQMLEALEVAFHRYPIYSDEQKAIRSLIESSSPSPGPSTTGESTHVVTNTNLVDEPNIPLDQTLKRFYEKRGYAAPSPAPLPKEADVQKSIHLSKSVEEAMGRISEIMEDRIHSMQSHASVYGSDRESAQMRAEANTLAEDVAVIRAALSRKPVTVTREWVETLAFSVAAEDQDDCDALIRKWLREKGIEVEP